MWDVSHAVGEQMVAKLDPQPGQTMLEVAAGTGETGFAAAARLGDDGRLISTDFSAPMVEAARRRADELELSNVEFQVMDAEQHGPRRRLRRRRAVPVGIHADGRSGSGAGGDSPRPATPAGASACPSGDRRTTTSGRRSRAGRSSRPVTLPAPEPGDPGIFAMSSEERIRELVTGAGFETVEIEPVRVEYRFEDFEEYWRFLHELAGAVALVLERLSADDLAQVREAMEQRAEPWRSNGGYVMPGVALNAVAS